MKLHGYSYSAPQVCFEGMLNGCRWLHQRAKVDWFSKKLFDSLFNNQRLHSEFSKLLNLLNHVVTWFEMGKQESKMTAQVCASDDILQMKLFLLLLKLSLSQVNQRFKECGIRNRQQRKYMNESDPRSDVHYLGSSENKA